ncbi:MAG: polymer-forming cytoskeletal protein [Saprospiraceae bacterium]|nr:polymer-forming cytoskeletal protein [Saprospiraceae bacterium]MBP7679406.1 polymer-forming cytoskeletal protein [Saprospiraceae bacterium]
MFGSKSNNSPMANKNLATTPSASINTLVKGTVVEGTVVSENDIRIDGTIKGTLNCNAKVIIGPTGYIDGQVRCTNAVIEGRFTGTLQVAELLSVRETAEISGEIATGKLVVQSGAVFNVSCAMDSSGMVRNMNMTNTAKPNASVPQNAGEKAKQAVG